MSLFRSKTIDEHTDSLVSFMPGGRPFLAARLPSTTLRNMLLGLGYEILRTESTISTIVDEHHITDTTQLISEWEKALGIPDCCFGVADNIQDRRRNVLIKLSMSIQTEQDLIDLAALLGFTVAFEQGANIGIFPFNSKFPITFFDRPQTARFTHYVTIYTLTFPNIFPLDFQIIFGDSFFNLMECLFRRLSPQNVNLIFTYELPDEGAIITENGRNYLSDENNIDLIIIE